MADSSMPISEAMVDLRVFLSAVVASALAVMDSVTSTLTVPTAVGRRVGTEDGLGTVGLGFGFFVGLGCDFVVGAGDGGHDAEPLLP